MGKEMKYYTVESRRDYTEIFDNYVYDYIYAESVEDAIELYKAYLIEHGCEPEEVEQMEFRVNMSKSSKISMRDDSLYICGIADYNIITIVREAIRVDCTLHVIQVDETYCNVVVSGAKENLHSFMQSLLWLERFIW